MDKVFSSTDSSCHRCNLNPIELMCYECSPMNSFCRNCDSITHSLPSKKHHKRDIVNFIFQNEQQKLKKENLKSHRKNQSLTIMNKSTLESNTPGKEISQTNLYGSNFSNVNNEKNCLTPHYDGNTRIMKEKIRNLESIKGKTIEFLEQDEKKFNYETNFKNYIRNNKNDKKIEQNFDNYENYKSCGYKTAKNNKNSADNFYENKNKKNLFYENFHQTNFSNSIKSTGGNLFETTSEVKNPVIYQNGNSIQNFKDTSNSQTDPKKNLMICYDNKICKNINNINRSNENDKENFVNNKIENKNLLENNNNEIICSDINKNIFNVQNSNSQNLNDPNGKIHANYVGNNFTTNSTTSYFSKEYVNELTSIHNKEKEDLIYKMNLLQNSLERMKISLTDQMINLQKQLDENNTNYSNKIKNLENQQKKLYEKNVWLNDQDKQKDKIIESLKMQMKKLKESNLELQEKYEYHLNACKNDKIIQQRQFDELQIKITQKENEIEDLKIFYNKKIEEILANQNNEKRLDMSTNIEQNANRNDGQIRNQDLNYIHPNSNYEFSLGNKIDTEKNFNQSDLNNLNNTEDFSVKQNDLNQQKYYIYNDTQEKNFINNTNNTFNNEYFQNNSHELNHNFNNTLLTNKNEFEPNSKESIDLKLELRNLKKLFYTLKDQNKILFENFEGQKKELNKKSDDILNLETKVVSYKQENDLLKAKLKTIQHDFSGYRKNIVNQSNYNTTTTNVSNITSNTNKRGMSNSQFEINQNYKNDSIKNEKFDMKSDRSHKNKPGEYERRSILGTNSFVSYD